MHPRSGVRTGALSDSLVRLQLERMLDSELFKRSERLSAFLRFVIEETLSGRGSTLKEQTLGSQLYGKGANFDGAADPIVRVDARRLRDKLREYYAEFPEDAVVISLPKGSYLPAFTERLTADATRNARHAVTPTRRWLAGVAALAAFAVLCWSALRNISSESQRPILITSFPGIKVAPALSPDGHLSGVPRWSAAA
jgi:hypothetical protein